MEGNPISCIHDSKHLFILAYDKGLKVKSQKQNALSYKLIQATSAHHHCH